MKNQHQLSCTVAIEFSAAKRLISFKGKCSRLHGYRHRIEVSFENKGVPKKNFMVADFNEIEKKLFGWIESHFDHQVILSKGDTTLGKAIEKVTGQKIYYMNEDPTAEAIANHLFRDIVPKLFPKLICTKIKLYDKPDAFVEISTG